MSASIEIRPFCSADAAGLITLCREHAKYERASLLNFDGVDSQQLVNRMSRLFEPEPNDGSPAAYCWVVAVEDELIGFASVGLELSTWMMGHYLHLDCLFLRESHRGQGLGQALMQRVAQKAVDLEAINLQWQTPVWNESAIRFYRRLGAVHAAKRRFTLEREDCERLAVTASTRLASS